MEDDKLFNAFKSIKNEENLQTKREMIDKLTKEEFISYLRYDYGNNSINCEVNDKGNYIIKDGDRYILEFEENVSLSNIYNYIEGNNDIVNELSNKSSYQVIDVNKLNTNTSVTNGQNYIIKIDTELFDEILKIYNKIYDDLKVWKRFANSSILSGELRDYYDRITGNNDIEKIMEEMISEFEDIVLKIEASINTYEEIDKSLYYSLNSLITEIFSLDSSIVNVEGSTYEDRRDYIDKTIKNLVHTLNVLEGEYEELYGEGIPIDGEKAIGFVNLLSSLGLFSLENGDIEKFSESESNVYTLYNKETGCFDIKQLGYVLNYCKERDVFTSIKKYVVEGEDWCSSGMDSLFGENLIKQTAYVVGPHHISFKQIEPYEGEYSGWCVFNENGNVICDAESVFLSNYTCSYINESEEIEKEFYVDVENINADLGDAYAPIDEKNGSSYYAHKFENGRYTVNWVFGMANTNHGQPFYHLMKLENKEYVSVVIKEHIKNNNVFSMFEEDDNTTKNIYDLYNEAVTMESDIMNMSQAIYQYRLYYNLMPYEEKRKNKDFSLYLNKDYSNYSNEIFESGEYENWLKYMDRSEVVLFEYLRSTEGEGYAKNYLKMLEDTINQRIGYMNAVSYVENLNEEDTYTLSDILILPPHYYLLSQFAPDAYDTIEDLATSSTTGLGDGLYNFGNGWYDLVTADGIRSAKDYEFMYKMQLLSTNNEYNNNLSATDRTFLKGVYEVGNSLGYMTVPTLLSYVPIVGKPLSTVSLLGSSTGNNTEDLMQQGISKQDAYLYGSLMGLSETAIEMLCGGLPGSQDVATKGLYGLVKSTFSEAGEEFVQTYVSAGIASCATGEPVDLSDLTGEALHAAVMAIFTSSAMNGGGKALIKLGDNIVEVSSKDYKTYEEWIGSVESKYRKTNPYLASLFIGKNNVSNQEVLLDVSVNNIANLTNEQKSLISSLKYNPETNNYDVTLMNGNSFVVNDMSELTSDKLLINFIGKETIDLSHKHKKRDKTLAKKVSMAMSQIENLNGDSLIEYVNSLDETTLVQNVKNSKGEEVTLLEYAWENGYTESDPFTDEVTPIIPTTIKESLTLAKLCIDKSVASIESIAGNLNPEILISEISDNHNHHLTFLEYLWENGYKDINDQNKIPDIAKFDVNVAKICIDNSEKINISNLIESLDATILTRKVKDSLGQELELLKYIINKEDIPNDTIIKSLNKENQISEEVIDILKSQIQNMGDSRHVKSLGKLLKVGTFDLQKEYLLDEKYQKMITDAWQFTNLISHKELSDGYFSFLSKNQSLYNSAPLVLLEKRYPALENVSQILTEEEYRKFVNEMLEHAKSLEGIKELAKVLIPSYDTNANYDNIDNNIRNTINNIFVSNNYDVVYNSLKSINDSVQYSFAKIDQIVHNYLTDQIIGSVWSKLNKAGITYDKNDTRSIEYKSHAGNKENVEVRFISRSDNHAFILHSIVDSRGRNSMASEVQKNPALWQSNPSKVLSTSIITFPNNTYAYGGGSLTKDFSWIQNASDSLYLGFYPSSIPIENVRGLYIKDAGIFNYAAPGDKKALGPSREFFEQFDQVVAEGINEVPIATNTPLLPDFMIIDEYTLRETPDFIDKTFNWANYYNIPIYCLCDNPSTVSQKYGQSLSTLGEANGNIEGDVNTIKQSEFENYLQLINENPFNFYSISDEIKMKYPKICIEAVKKDSDMFYAIPNEILIEHPEISIELVKQNVRLILSIPNEILIQQPKIYLEAAKQDGDVLDIAPTDIMIQHPEICLEAIKQNADKIKNVPDQLLTEEMYLKMLSVNSFIVQNVPESFKIKYSEICSEAEKKCIIDIKEKCVQKAKNSKTVKEREYLTKFYDEYLLKFIDNPLISKQVIYDSCDKFNFLSREDFDKRWGEGSERVAAFNSMGTIYVPFDDGTRPINDYFETICHEFTHTCGKFVSDDVSTEYLVITTGINEAFTEIIAQEILDYDTSYISYSEAVKGIKDIISLDIPGLSRTDFDIAYFQTHDLTNIKKAIDDLMGEGYFDSTLLPAFNTVSVRSDDQDTTKIKKVTDEIRLKYSSMNNML